MKTLINLNMDGFLNRILASSKHWGADTVYWEEVTGHHADVLGVLEYLDENNAFDDFIKNNSSKEFTEGENNQYTIGVI